MEHTTQTRVFSRAHRSAAAWQLCWLAAVALVGCGDDGVQPPKAAEERPAALQLSGAQRLRGTEGQAFEAELRVSGGAEGYTWSLRDGALPSGIKLKEFDAGALLYGVPDAHGEFSFTVQVADSAGESAALNIDMLVAAAPAGLEIQTTELPAGRVGVSYQARLEASGGSAGYNWRLEAGALPAGLSLDSAGTLSGTPTASGAAVFTLAVRDLEGQEASRGLAIWIDAPAPAPEPLQIVSDLSAVPDGVLGEDYTAEFSARGGSGASYQWEAEGLPEGLSLSGGTPSATLSGTVQLAGRYEITLRVTDSEQNSAEAQLSITWSAAPQPLSIVTRTLPNASFGEAYEASIRATNGAADDYRWSVVGSLPRGLALDAEGTPNTRIHGTPTEYGDFSFSIQVRDAEGQQATQELSMEVSVRQDGALALPVQNIANPVIGVRYAATVIALGGEGQLSWAVSDGSLPPGLSLSPHGRPAATISGIPVAEFGSWDFELSVRDSAGAEARRSFSLTISEDHSAALNITTSTLSAGCLPMSAAIHAEGGNLWRYHWSSPDLPAGLSLIEEGNSARLSGIPRAAGPYEFTVEVSDSAGRAARRSYALDLAGANMRWLIAAGWTGTNYARRLSAIDVCGATPGTRLDISPDLPAGSSIQARNTHPLPDGRRVVFLGALSVRREVNAYITDITNPDPQQINLRGEDSDDVKNAVPSPDGSKVAYMGDLRVNNQNDVFVADVTDPANIPTPSCLSPDTPEGGDALFALSWSPDSSTLAFVGDLRVDGEDQLFIADLSGPTPSVEAVAGVSAPSSRVLWDASASYLYFTAADAEDPEGRRQLWRVAPGPSPAAERVSGAALSDPVVDEDNRGGQLRRWALSADGARLFFTATQSLGVGMYLVDLSSLTVRAVPAAPAAELEYGAWAPDGSLLAVAGATYTPDLTELSVLDPSAETLRLTKVSGTMPSGGGLLTTTNQHYASRLRWSPDSSRIAFVARKDATYWDALYVVDPRTPGEPESLLGDDPRGDVEEFRWSPDGSMIAGFGGVVNAYAQDAFIVHHDGSDAVRIDATEVDSAPRKLLFSRGSDWVYFSIGLGSRTESIYRYAVSDLAALAAQETPSAQRVASAPDSSRDIGDMLSAEAPQLARAPGG